MDEQEFPAWQRRWRITVLSAFALIMAYAAAASIMARAHPVAVAALCYAATFGVAAPIILAIRRLHTSDVLTHRLSLELGTAVPTSLEFASPHFASAREDAQSFEEPSGQLLALFLAERLEARGFRVDGIDHDDGIWWIELADGPISMTIGCASDPLRPELFRVSLEPAAPFVRVWLRRSPTAGPLMEIGGALFSFLRESGRVSQLRWRTSREELEDRFGPSCG